MGQHLVRYLQVKLAEVDELAYLCRYLDELVAAECQDAQVHQVPNVGWQNLKIIITVKARTKIVFFLAISHITQLDRESL